MEDPRRGFDAPADGLSPPSGSRRSPKAREDLEGAMVGDALGRHRSVARTAGELGVTRQGLSKLMARLDIDRFIPGRDRSAQMPSR